VSLTIGQIVVMSYDYVMEHCPADPPMTLLAALLGPPDRRTYRERLDAAKVNSRGRPLSRREVLEWNLRKWRQNSRRIGTPKIPQ
jgi:hypothetical protein